MTASSPQFTDSGLPDWAPSIARAVGQPIVRAERLGTGGNGQAWRVDCEGGGAFAVKFYFRDEHDRRDRLGTEFSALEFLARHGETAVARPIGRSTQEGFACYELIEGAPVGDILTGEIDVSTGDIDDAAALLVRLNRLTTAPGADGLPNASEACYSVDQIVANIRMRRERLAHIPQVEARFPPLCAFLDDKLMPALYQFTRRAAGILGGRDGCSRELPLRCRTLSPSDFGFHNAVRRQNGQLAFVDFEYFGWDDPAKTVVDFILHPGMNLSINLRHRFTEKLLQGLGHVPELRTRVTAVYPLFGVKWCLILLNEFLAHSLQRRGFARGKTLNEHEAQTRQLEKAEALLSRIVKDHENVGID